jgi:hypothetical protein
LLAAAESRKLIISCDETPSASGTLLGSEFGNGFSLQETMVKQKRITAMKEFFKIVFINQVINNSLNF